MCVHRFVINAESKVTCTEVGLLIYQADVNLVLDYIVIDMLIGECGIVQCSGSHH